jgi:hypothetical protein
LNTNPNSEPETNPNTFEKEGITPKKNKKKA